MREKAGFSTRALQYYSSTVENHGIKINAADKPKLT